MDTVFVTLPPAINETVKWLSLRPMLIIITIIEICKAPTLRFKVLNKHSLTHIMYFEMEMLSAIKMDIRKKEKANL